MTKLEDVSVKCAGKCGKFRKITDFHWRHKSKGIRHTICKYCRNEPKKTKEVETDLYNKLAKTKW